MKKYIFSLTFACLILSFSIILYANEEEKISLKDMTEEKCFETLLENGLEVPESFENYSDLLGFVKRVVDGVLMDPERISWYNFTESQDFAMIIRSAVLEYEGIEEPVQSGFSFSLYNTASTGLQFSTLVSEWDSSCLYYNCYAYAVNKANLGCINPGHTVDEYTMSASHLETMTIGRLAWFVEQDLRAWGYTDITKSLTVPSYTPGYRIIAVRKCSYDYHFMYLYSISGSNVWRHKPSISAILKYNYSNPLSGMWTNEGVDGHGYWSWGTVYDSDIMYIKYK